MSDPEENNNRRRRFSAAAVLCFLAIICWSGYMALTHPATPLPRGWNPTLDLKVSDPVTGITNWKLTKATSDPQVCLAALRETVEFISLEPKTDSENCHIETRVRVTQVGAASVQPLETSCAIALRIAMWERHGLQPAAQEQFATRITEIHQIGSYNCRKIRTASGSSERMSLHATAEAVDITGFTLANGEKLNLISDWQGSARKSAFLEETRDSGCKWFRTVLSPDFNALHADHFHLQSRGWGTCR